ncbi:MAG: alpha/beta hydrolase [Burkholderiales bacterium]|nr:alpha/beta hydrolase [Burkholderiales bacterium]
MNALFSRLGDYLLQKALAAECQQAGLTPASAPLSFGQIAYLHNAQTAGEAVVLLHGATADKSSWARFAKFLGKRYRLLVPDLPGHGASVVDMALDYSIHAQAERLLEWFAQLGLQRLHLIGNSMGGTLALHLAAHHPQKVASLVLIDTAGIESRPSWLRQHATATGQNPMINVNSVADYRAMMRIGMAKLPYIPGFLLAALTRVFIQRKAINQKIVQDIERDLDQKSTLSQIQAPSLIIWGALDKVQHVADADFLQQQLANSSKLILENIGHVPMVEAPKQVAEACSAFLAKHSRENR